MKNKRRGGWLILLLICTLSVPAVSMLLYGTSFSDFASARPYILAGAALGALHVCLRPILRIISAPLGCITFGLAGTGIDIALIYVAARFIDGFHVPSFWFALITALLINAVSSFMGVKSH